MGNDSDNRTNRSASGERSLVDAAWAQFESLVATQKHGSNGPRISLTIPGYHVLREIHRGGQGVVYQAMQESTQRKVAIKVLKEGPLANLTELARFDREVDVLSRLNHPHIVAIHDRGTTAAGHAYCVMDYIPGRALDAYVSGQALPTLEILKLFLQICEAVNIAHLRGVIHRDLKPSNIRIDEEGRPHILDFGLAKLIDDANARSSTMTISGQFVGSLPWASPEQAEGRSEQLDVRTDVYSLGVILYQLLTRSFPYPVSGRMDDVIRSIVHTNPARPSTLSRAISRDVEVIMLKCLEKDPERRYQSAGELARDIQRFLKGEPIEARPATSLYQLRQFARRNKTLVASAVAITSILTTATIVSIAYAVRATAAREETRAVADFQAQMLADIDPQAMGVKLRTDLLAKTRIANESAGRPREEIDSRMNELENLVAGVDLTGFALTTLEENVFKTAVAAIKSKFAEQPLVQAHLLQTIATTQRDLGLLESATQPQVQALEIRHRLLGDDHPETLSSSSEMGLLFQQQGKLHEAKVYLTKVLESRRRVLGDDHPDTLSSVSNVGLVLLSQGELVEAEAYYRSALESRRRVLGDDHADTICSIHGMGQLLEVQGKLSDAERYYREAMTKRHRVLGAEHPDTLTSIGAVGVVLMDQGKLKESEPFFREALDKRLSVMGHEHPTTLAATINMGYLLHGEGKLAEAEAMYRDGLEKQSRVLGIDHPHTLTSQNNLGMLLIEQGRFAEAEECYRDVLERRRRVLGSEHPKTVNSVHNMGQLLREQGKLAEAEPFYREALEKYRRIQGDGTRNTLICLVSLGDVLQAQGKATEAIELLAPAEVAARSTFSGANSPSLARFLSAVGCARVAAGEFDAAAANLNEAYELMGLSKSKSAAEPERLGIATCLVQLYEAWNTAAPNLGYDDLATQWREKIVQ